MRRVILFVNQFFMILISKILIILIINRQLTYCYQVIVKLPSLVQYREDALLTCSPKIDLKNVSSLTWYKDDVIVYRYYPLKDDKERQIFRKNNQVNIDLQSSNLTHLTLKSLTTSASGNYSCKVQTIAPEYRISINSSELTVYYPPQNDNPQILMQTLDKSSELLCKSTATNPAVSLQWLINGESVKSEKTVILPIVHINDSLMVSFDFM